MPSFRLIPPCLSNRSLTRNTSLTATLLATLCLAACKPAEEATLQSARGSAPVPVQAAKAIRQTLPITQISIGTAQPIRTVSIKSQVDGTIEKIHFREGDEVKTGALLVTIDRRPFENALRIARADLDNARAQDNSAQSDFARYEHLYKASLVTKEDYDQYRAKAEVSRAQVVAKDAAVSNAQLQLGYTEIRAPISGRTGQFGLHEGSLVKAADAATPLLVINQISPISVAYSVPEEILSQVRAALAAAGGGNSTENIGAISTTAVPAGSTTAAQGRLDFIDNAVDATTGTILLKAVFPNTDHALWPGQFVNITMELGHETDTIIVPSAAVQSGQKGTYVFVITPEKTVQLRTVKVGRISKGLSVILNGVSEGDNVVTDGHLRLTDGAKIEIKTLDDMLAGTPAVTQ